MGSHGLFFLHRALHDRFDRLVESHVDHLHAGLFQADGDDLGTPVVPV